MARNISDRAQASGAFAQSVVSDKSARSHFSRTLLRQVPDAPRGRRAEFSAVRMEGLSCHDDEQCGEFREELRQLAEHNAPQFMATAFCARA